MEALKQRIRAEGKVRGNNEVLKVDSFLNHQMDVAFLQEIGQEFRRRFAGCQVDRILTIEASGIAIACLAAPAFGNVPVVFAKKNRTKNIAGDVYISQVESFTQDRRPYNILSPRSSSTPGKRFSCWTTSWPTAVPSRPSPTWSARPARKWWGPGWSLRRPSSPAGSGCGRTGSGWNPWPASSP